MKNRWGELEKERDDFPGATERALRKRENHLRGQVGLETNSVGVKRIRQEIEVADLGL